jgi:hypothetical protein
MINNFGVHVRRWSGGEEALYKSVLQVNVIVMHYL